MPSLRVRCMCAEVCFGFECDVFVTPGRHTCLDDLHRSEWSYAKTGSCCWVVLGTNRASNRNELSQERVAQKFTRPHEPNQATATSKFCALTVNDDESRFFVFSRNLSRGDRLIEFSSWQVRKCYAACSTIQFVVCGILHCCRIYII